MKAILVFKLPQEQEEYELAVNGVNYSIVLEEVDNALRQMEKYEDKEIITIEEARKLINFYMEKRGLL